jgi:hypothetical protein
MDFNATIDLIIKDLRETAEIIDDLKKYPGVPFLQVELAKSKCKSAGEVISLLKNLTEKISVAVTSPPVEPEPAVVIPPSPVIATAPLIDLETSIDPAPVTVPSPIKTPTPVQKTDSPKKEREKVTDYAILADKFNRPSNRSDGQSDNRAIEEDASEILMARPITNLFEAIGLNDKFLFIGEIFKGNKEEYAQIISRLDKAENLSDARAIITSYTGNSNENEAVKQLLRLVKRKFPPHE